MMALLRRHWPEYLMEGAELGLFMVSASFFTVLFDYPGSPVRQVLPDPALRRSLIGLAMGLTAAAIIYSPWGKQSGAHFNPAVTLTFFRLGKVAPGDAAFYGAAHFGGGLAGVLVSAALLGRSFTDPAVNYIVTIPGRSGPAAAFAAELLMSFVLMMTVLYTINRRAVSAYTGLIVGLLVAVFVAFESPLSGMSLNPARTLASAVPARDWTALWVYFVAPPFGMMLAAQAYLGLHGPRSVKSAKLHHANNKRCIFRCDHADHTRPL